MPENRNNLTDQTVERLRDLIAQSGLGPGEPFAIESDLEQRLGVSRAILREAISRLRALGVLDSRQGVGLMIGQPDPVALFERALECCVSAALDLAELAELRYVLEVGSAALAVTRGTAEQMERLALLAEQLADAQSHARSSRAIDDVELDFHRTLLEATHNETLARMHHVIAGYFTRSAQEVPDYDPSRTEEQTVWEHRAIARAMADRDVEGVRALLGGHLRKALRGRGHA